MGDRLVETLDGGSLRGGILQAHLEWVRETHGDVGIIKLWSALPPETATALVGNLRESGLYPFRHLVTLDRTIAQLFGFDDEPLLIELGRHSARRNLSTTFRDFDKHHPHLFFEQSARLHAQWQDFGRAIYEKVGATSCRLKMVEYPCFSKTYCWSAIGYYAQATEMQGGEDVRVMESTCQCEGESACQFEIQWK